jgi:hypothetical protein
MVRFTRMVSPMKTGARNCHESRPTNAAVAIFCIAAIIESFGYLFRWVDLILDLLAAPLAALAGAVLMTSQLTVLVDVSARGDAAQVLEPLMHPAFAWSIGIAVGVLVASGVEAASIFGRLTSSVLTIGWLNPTRCRRSVLFPHPEPPITKKISPGRTANDTPSSTVPPS